MAHARILESRKMRTIPCLALAGTMALAAPAAAQGPVAVVEDVTGPSAGVGFMDYVEAGKVIRLAPRDSIVLGYMRSCVRETITGGTLTVGATQSEVQSGQVERTTVACDAGKMMLTVQQAEQAAGLVLRGNPPIKPVPKPQFVLYGASPIVEMRGGGTVIIERLDSAGDRQVVQIAKTPQGPIFDFADGGRALAAGGIYRIIVGTRQFVFKVDTGAKAGRTPIVGRMLRFDPVS
jgi:hypothetical protein